MAAATLPCADPLWEPHDIARCTERTTRRTCADCRAEGALRWAEWRARQDPWRAVPMLLSLSLRIEVKFCACEEPHTDRRLIDETEHTLQALDREGALAAIRERLS